MGIALWCVIEVLFVVELVGSTLRLFVCWLWPVM